MINMDLSDHSRADSLINQKLTRSFAQLHPESNVCPTSHACEYLHLRIRSITLNSGLHHLLFMIYMIIWWGWNHVPNECANIYKIYCTQ